MPGLLATLGALSLHEQTLPPRLRLRAGRWGSSHSPIQEWPELAHGDGAPVLQGKVNAFTLMVTIMGNPFLRLDLLCQDESSSLLNIKPSLRTACPPFHTGCSLQKSRYLSSDSHPRLALFPQRVLLWQFWFSIHLICAYPPSVNLHLETSKYPTKCEPWDFLTRDEASGRTERAQDPLPFHGVRVQGKEGWVDVIHSLYFLNHLGRPRPKASN